MTYNVFGGTLNPAQSNALKITRSRPWHFKVTWRDQWSHLCSRSHFLL